MAQEPPGAFQGTGPDPVAPFVPGPAFVDTADPALAGAEEVVADVQNVMFWSRFQQGAYDGWSYVLFPDGSATVMQRNGRSEAAFTLVCASGAACLVTGTDGTTFEVPAIGASRPDSAGITDGETLSRYLAEWILAGTGTPPPPPVAEVAPTLVVLVAAETEGEDGAAAGGGATEDDRAPEAVTERIGTPIDTCPELPGMVPNICSDDAPDGREEAPAPAAPARTEGEVAPSGRTGSEIPPQVEPPLTQAERANLKCFATATISLSHTDGDTGTSGPGKPRGSLGCGGNITERLAFQFSLVEYLIPDQQKPWDPDFTYSLNYKVSDDLTLNYANYLARFDGPNGEGNLLDSLLDGNLRANYKFPKVNLPNGDTLACVGGIGLPRIFEERGSLSCGAGITDKLRVGGTAYFYFPGEQGTFDPDFSYTASYRINDDFRLTYSNYSNNRWVWNPSNEPGPGFLGGSLSLTYTFGFLRPTGCANSAGAGQSEQARVSGDHRGMGAVLCLELSAERHDVHLDRHLLQPQLARDLLVGEPSTHAAEHLDLSRAELLGQGMVDLRRIGLVHEADRDVLLAHCHEADRVQQGLCRHRLGQKTDGPGFDRLLRDFSVCDARHEGDRPTAVGLHGQCQPVEAFHARHLVVQKDKVEPIRRLDTRTSGIEIFHEGQVEPAGILEESPQCLAHQHVVVGNQHADHHSACSNCPEFNRNGRSGKP